MIEDDLYKVTENGMLCYNLEEFHNREAREIGYNEGIDHGKKEGFEEGLSKGIEAGKKSVIEKLLKSDLSKEEICNFLDISLEELKKILNEKIG